MSITEQEKLLGKAGEQFLAEHKASLIEGCSYAEKKARSRSAQPGFSAAYKASKKKFGAEEDAVSVISVKMEDGYHLFVVGNDDTSPKTKGLGGMGQVKFMREVLPIKDENGVIRDLLWLPNDGNNPLLGVKRALLPSEIESVHKCSREKAIKTAMISAEDNLNELEIFSALGYSTAHFQLDSRNGEVKDYVVIPYFPNGDLVELYKTKQGEFSDVELLEFVEKLLNMVEQLNEAGYIHRDIKLNNIVLDQNDLPHLIDFGFTRPKSDFPVSQFSGTPNHIAPELFDMPKGQYTYNEKTDAFAMGVVLQRLLLSLPQNNQSAVAQELGTISAYMRYAQPNDRWDCSGALRKVQQLKKQVSNASKSGATQKGRSVSDPGGITRALGGRTASPARPFSPTMTALSLDQIPSLLNSKMMKTDDQAYSDILIDFVLQVTDTKELLALVKACENTYIHVCHETVTADKLAALQNLSIHALKRAVQLNSDTGSTIVSDQERLRPMKEAFKHAKFMSAQPKEKRKFFAKKQERFDATEAQTVVENILAKSKPYDQEDSKHMRVVSPIQSKISLGKN